MNDVLTGYSTRKTPQNQRANSKQKRNAAGGFTFTITDEQRLSRFLTLGTDAGTFYVGAATLTRENAEVVVRMAENDHATLVDTIVDISTRGAAPKQNPAIFALAIAASHGDADERRRALDALPKVARIGTHLFLFATYIEQFRGWGRGLRRAVADWYTSKDANRLAYQAVKYRQREGWTHRDLLRLSHPEATEPATRALFDWIAHGATDEDTPRLVEGFLKAQENDADIPALIAQYDLSWEMLPDAALNQASTWEALLDSGIPQTALMRQLPRLTRLGLLPQMGGRTAEVAARLADAERLRKARVHPINVLIAQRTYSAGRSERGNSIWTPSQKIVDALDDAFYKAFGAVTPANKRTLASLDISGSMEQRIGGMPMSAREASAALALVQLATEPESAAVGFSSSNGRMFGPTEMIELSLSPRQRLDDAVRAVSNLPFGGTDCSLPMKYALEQGIEVDTFVVYTDSETWAGRSHPHQALREYREKTGIDAKMAVVGMTATDASIADPNDPGMLDVAGFDPSVPNVISEFSRGL